MNKYEIKHNRQYAAWARRLINEKPDLEYLRGSGVKIAFLSSQQEKTTGHGQRAVLGECVEIKENMQWAAPYDFMVIIYEQNCFSFSEEQTKILLWHELRHIGIDLDSDEPSFYVVPHDYEDFDEIIRQHGLLWDKVV